MRRTTDITSFKTTLDDNFYLKPGKKTNKHEEDECGAKTGTLTYLDHGLISVNESFSSVQKKKKHSKYSNTWFDCSLK